MSKKTEVQNHSEYDYVRKLHSIFGNTGYKDLNDVLRALDEADLGLPLSFSDCVTFPHHVLLHGSLVSPKVRTKPFLDILEDYKDHAPILCIDRGAPPDMSLNIVLSFSSLDACLDAAFDWHNSNIGLTLTISKLGESLHVVALPLHLMKKVNASK